MMTEPRRMLGRSPVTNYVTLEGLQLLTGVSPSDFDLLALKELIDNALDASDEINLPHPVINVQVRKVGDLLELTVRDNAFGVDAEGIKKITDFSRLYSSRFHYKYPTRGALGNAWKYLLGMTVALSRATKTEYPKSPVRIISHGKCHHIDVIYESGDVFTKVTSSKTELENSTGTTVVLSLPVYSSEWLKANRYLHLIEGFAYFNPHAEIIFENIKGETLRYPSLEGSTSNPKNLRESIYWFSQDEFRERVEAEIRDHVESEVHPSLTSFMKGFRGLSSDRKVHRVLGPLGFTLLEELDGKPEAIASLYQGMKRECESPSASVLTRIGDMSLLTRVAQIDRLVGLEDRSYHRYFQYRSKRHVFKFTRTGAHVPFIVEVLVAVNQQRGRFIHVGVNRSPKLEDPFGSVIFDFKRGEERVTGIKGIVERNGIKFDDPVTVLIHIMCPNIQYRDLGKIHMDLVPFFEEVKEAVDKASRFYKRAKRRIVALKSGSYVPETIKGATLKVLPEAINFVSSGGKFSYKQRQLWYVVRDIFDKKGWSQYSPTYDYFPNKLIPEAIETTDINLKGLLKEASAELHDPRSKVSVPLSTEGVESYEIPEWKYNKILYVEKRGFKDVIVTNRFHDRYDMAVIGAQGESSVDTRKLLKRIEEIVSKQGRNGEEIEILCIHDADLWGHDISLTLSHPSQRMKHHRLKVTDLGLTMKEALGLGLKPERVIHKRPKRIPQKLLRLLPPEELLLLTRKKKAYELYQPLKESYRVELNAFTPEQFMDWLTRKLEEHGVKRKVRPPEDVTAKETQERVNESLEKHVKDMIFELCGGQKVLDELKAYVTAREELEKLDVSGEMDQNLETYPTDGWNDIIKQEVNTHIDKVFEKGWICKEIHKTVLTQLTLRKNFQK